MLPVVGCDACVDPVDPAVAPVSEPVEDPVVEPVPVDPADPIELPDDPIEPWLLSRRPRTSTRCPTYFLRSSDFPVSRYPEVEPDVALGLSMEPAVEDPALELGFELVGEVAELVAPVDELEPYGEDELLALDEEPTETSVRMNRSLIDVELLLSLVPDVLLVALPDVPVLPIVPALSAVLRQPVNVMVLALLSDLFQSLDDVELGADVLVWPLVAVDCAAAGPAISTADARIPITI
jgi:hypothetical protein